MNRPNAIKCGPGKESRGRFCRFRLHATVKGMLRADYPAGDAIHASGSLASLADPDDTMQPGDLCQVEAVIRVGRIQATQIYAPS